MTQATPTAALQPTAAPGTSQPAVCLALSGGNALGAYAAGAVEALEQAGTRFDLISGASIGAVTSAIVAGSRPGQASKALRELWAQSSSGPAVAWPWLSAGRPREWANAAHAVQTLLFGRPGLFTPRPSGFMSLMPGMPPDIALFNSHPIAATLERLVDFDYLHDHGPRLVICTVDLESGEAVYFDSRKERITPQHVLASTGFLPSFPPVEIGGRLLGDPGLVCNLPLDPILFDQTGDRVCFTVDLFSSAGPRPHSLDTSVERAQDITFSAQTTRTLQAFQREQRLRHLLWQARPAGGEGATASAAPGQVDVVLAAYRALPHELCAKTLEFSAASLQERWTAGRRDMAAGIEALTDKRPGGGGLGFNLYRGVAAEEPVTA